ncbi:putative sulfate exporter family transporter [Photobacterium rosenbergii]|uniref:Putative sulfate exporter family transporter n=1 Tax=Photobacterium rosenbergii TaxID=294936 RepID=A0A2T3NL06_9GAMM|nr:putative sulfate exporter family transporter [Photobacterium rosenbergii]PSW16206.1 putative sulfate exporter family transporter [Photobacterium rosenbergii]
MTERALKLPKPLLSGLNEFVPGLLLCVVIAAAASFVSAQYGGPTFLYALLIGISFHFLSDNPKCQPGIDVSAKKLVRVGVALLGVRIAISDVHAIGALGVTALAGAVVLTIGFSLMLAKLLRLPSMLGILSGGATGICGISAAMAISSTLPQNRENEHYTLLTAIGVAAFSTIAMVLYPLVVSVLELSRSEAGLFLGGSIHDVAQVVGAGFMISPEVGDSATLAKMFRVAMLMPVVVVFAFWFRSARQASGSDKAGNQPLVPFFLLVFIGLVIVNSLGWIPPVAVEMSSDISKWCLVISIAALGVKTSFEKLSELGWKPIALLMGNALFIAAYMLVVVYLGRMIF